MAIATINVGIMAPSQETRDLLRNQVTASKSTIVAAEAEQYCTASTDPVVRRFLDTAAGLIFVDMQDPHKAIRSLQVLHASIPSSWLIACSDVNDPQLIIDTMRAGAREFLVKPIMAAQLSQALERYLADTQHANNVGGIGQIYAVTTAKGGAGATSVAINLAACLNEASENRVALIDLNSPGGDAAAYLSIKPQFTVSDALSSASRLDPVLLESYMSRAYGLSVLPGPKEFQPRHMPDLYELAKLLEVAAQTYTHAILDLPSSWDEDYTRILTEMSDGIIVVLTPELPALWRTHRLLQFLKTSGGTEKLKLVLNRCGTADEITNSDIEKALSHPVYWRLPNNYNSAIEAINSGKPLVSLNHSALARSYHELAFRLAGIVVPEKRRRLFERLFDKAGGS
ncbi:MAG TPA: AAA family ATPase [Acidobacteriota bacterium]|jgi:pilus assembly protein CpaE|nr:AAA family ATPase [Acidobacteriota bacterium]